MSCNITRGRRKTCINNIGGIKEVYISRYIQYNVADYVGELGVELTSVPTRFFYKFELDGRNASFTESMKVDDNGKYFDVNLSLSFVKLDKDTARELNALKSSLFHVIIKLKNGKYYFLGFENGLELSGLEVLSGSNLTDFQGYNLTFEGMEEHKGMLIDNLEEADILVGIDGVFVWGLRQENKIIADENNNFINSNYNE